jgi:hypothetical protein
MKELLSVRRKRRTRSLAAALAVLALVGSACTSTFLVSKNGRGYFLGSGSSSVYAMLCESGDLKKVLADTQLPQALQDDLYTYNCSPERSGKRVRDLYAAMSPEQRKDLRLAFKHNGYDINYLPC